MTSPRRRCRVRRRRDLVERLAPYLRPIEPEPVRLVSVEPVRWWLEGWGAATGDSPEVIARGFGLDSAWVAAVLAGNLRRLSPQEAAEVCRSLGVAPAEFWSA